MSKIVVALFIVAVASVAHAQLTTEQKDELQNSKDQCISDIKWVMGEISTQIDSIKSYLDEISTKDMIAVLGPTTLNLEKLLQIVQNIDVSEVDPESESFEQVIDDCTTLVAEGSDCVAYINDLNTRIWSAK